MDVWTTSSTASVFRALLGNAALTSRMCSAAVSLHASNMSREQTSTSVWNGFKFQVENHPWWMNCSYHPEPKQEFWASGQEYNQENGCALWIHLPQSDCQCRVLLSFSKNSVEATSSVKHAVTSSQRKTFHAGVQLSADRLPSKFSLVKSELNTFVWIFSEVTSVYKNGYYIL